MAVALCTVTRAQGEIPSLPAQSSSTLKLVVLRANRMLDVLRGETVAPAVVAIKDNLIVSVTREFPSKAGEVIDLGDVTLLPGLIDVHTHLVLNTDDGWEQMTVRDTPADAAIRGVPNARKTLLAGFTTVRDLGNWGGFPDVALMRAIERGLIDGPRIIPCGRELSMTGGHADITGYAPGVRELGPHDGTADGTAEILKAVRYMAKHGAKVIKVCATGGVLSEEPMVGAQQYSEEELRVMVEEARRHGLKVAAHAHGTDGIIAAIRAGVASIEHGTILNEEAVLLLKEKGVYLVMNPYIEDSEDVTKLPPLMRTKAEQLKPHFERSIRMAIEAGVKMAYGTDAGVFPHGDNARQFSSFVKRGVRPLEAIRMASIHAADLMELDDRGVIAPGKLADLIAVDGNPLEDIRVLEQVRFVMKDGKVFKHSK
jgi:imidazolonepropionase-like amidohydrolase